MTVDLAPYLDAVPDVVVERLRGARRVLAVGHENPDADTLGATLGVVAHRRGAGRHGRRRSAPIRPRRCTTSSPGIDRFRTDPDPDADYDLLVISDCGSLDADRRGRATRHAELFERLPRVVIDHHASNDAAGDADWIDPAPPRPARWSRCSPPGSASRFDARRRRAGRRPDGRHRHGHRDVRPSERDAADARRLGGAVEAGAPLSDISRRLYRTKPDAQLRLFGVVLDRLESADDGRDRVVDADSTPTSPRPAPSAPHSEGIIDLLAAGRGRRGRHPVQGGRRGDADQRPDEARRRRRDGPDRAGSAAAATPGRPARPSTLPARRRRDRRSSPRPTPARRRARPLSVARSSLGPGLDGILVVAKPAGPTSHDVVGARPAAGRDQARRPRRDARPVRVRACCRSSSATRRASSSTTSPIARPTARRSASGRRRRPTTSRAS